MGEFSERIEELRAEKRQLFQDMWILMKTDTPGPEHEAHVERLRQRYDRITVEVAALESHDEDD